MRRVITTILLAVAVVATTAPITDAQYTFSSMNQPKSRRRGSKRSADSGNNDSSTERGMPVSSSSMNAAQQGAKGGYSFSDLGNANSGKGSQKQPSSTTSTSTTSATTASTTATTASATATTAASAKQSAVTKADNVTAKVPLGKSQAAAVPLTPETPAYTEDTDPKQSDVEVPSPSPTVPAKKSLGESQVAGHPVVSTPTSAPPADDDDDEEEEEQNDEEEEDEEEETEEESQDPSTDDTNNPKQSYT